MHRARIDIDAGDIRRRMNVMLTMLVSGLDHTLLMTGMLELVRIAMCGVGKVHTHLTNEHAVP